MALPIQSLAQVGGLSTLSPGSDQLREALNQAVANTGKNLPVGEFRELPPLQIPGITAPLPAPNAPIVEPTTWGRTAHHVVEQVSDYQKVAAEKIQDVLAGGPTQVHDAMIAVEEASLSFQVLAEVRNKVVESYQEIMRMQV